jgi:hypothetical protein
MMYDDNGLYYIIYPAGDKTKLTVLFLSYTMNYEIGDYSLASRKEFNDKKEAIAHAKYLAVKHGLKYESDEPQYLD